MPAPRGLSYRDVLLTNVMDTEGAEWPEAPFRPSLGMRLEMLKKVSRQYQYALRARCIRG